ncbi:MAG TPA: hypothetical protein VGC37_18690 [Friedmanniella sp.]
MSTITKGRGPRLVALAVAGALTCGGVAAGVAPALAAEGDIVEASAAIETVTPALVDQQVELEVGEVTTVDILAGATAGPEGAQWVSVEAGPVGTGLAVAAPSAVTDGTFAVEVTAVAPGAWAVPVTAWSWWPEAAADGVEVTGTLTVLVTEPGVEEPAPEPSEPVVETPSAPDSPVDAPPAPAGPYTHVAAMDQATYDAWLREWRTPYFEELSGESAVPFPFYSAPASDFCADPTVGVTRNGEEAFVRPVNTSASVPPIMEVWATTGQDGTYVDILGSECAKAWGITEFWLPDGLFSGSDQVVWEKSADGRGVNVVNRTGNGSSFISAARLPGGEWALLQINTVADYLQLNDRTIEVPVGQTASVNLLEGAQWQRGSLPNLGLDGVDVALEVDATIAQTLALEVTSPIASVTPQQEGSWRIPVNATAPSGQTGAATLTVVATTDATPSVTVSDRTVALTVGQSAEIDLLEGVTSTAALDELIFGANADGDVDEFRTATGWSRFGRTVTVEPTTAGVFEASVWAMTPDYLGYGSGTLTLVVTEPTVVPESTPSSAAPSPESETPVTAPVVAPPVTPAPEPSGTSALRFETGVPGEAAGLATLQAGVQVGLGAALLGAAGLAGLGLRRRRAQR